MLHVLKKERECSKRPSSDDFEWRTTLFSNIRNHDSFRRWGDDTSDAIGRTKEISFI